MNKSEVTWLIIRFTGLFLAVKAVIILPDLISSLWFVFTVGPDVSIETPGAKFAIQATMKEITEQLLSVVLYGFCATYLLFRGYAVFKLVRIPSINNEHSNK